VCDAIASVFFIPQIVQRMAKRKSDMLGIQFVPKSHKKKVQGSPVDDLMKQIEANLNPVKKPTQVSSAKEYVYCGSNKVNKSSNDPRPQQRRQRQIDSRSTSSNSEGITIPGSVLRLCQWLK